MRVRVYLHTPKTKKAGYNIYSIVDVSTGKVIAHEEKVLLLNCEFKVSEAGRQRVLREKRKNVHAFVVGDYTPLGQRPFWDEGYPFMYYTYYDPYTCESFMAHDTPIYSAPVAICSQKGVWTFLKGAQ